MRQRSGGSSGASIELPTGQRARLTGIGLLAAAVLCFSLLDTSAKYLAADLPIIEIVWGRYFFHFVLMLAVLNPLSTPGLMVSRRLGLQIARSAMLVAVTGCNFLALRYLQLDQTVSITFSVPFLIALLAGPLLGEWVDGRRMAAVVLGFVGVLIVVQPSLDLHPAVLVAILGAVFFAFYNLATRMLAAFDASSTTLFFSGLVGVVATSPFALIGWVWPTPLGWALMVGLGALGGFGHWLLILAHHYAPASVVAPFMYSQLLWMVALGYLVFGNVPSPVTIVGAAVMIAAGIYLITRERMALPPSSEVE